METDQLGSENRSPTLAIFATFAKLEVLKWDELQRHRHDGDVDRSTRSGGIRRSISSAETETPCLTLF